MPGRRAEREKEFSYRRSDGWQLFDLDNGVHFRMLDEQVIEHVAPSFGIRIPPAFARER
jgi:hypothetical protein